MTDWDGTIANAPPCGFNVTFENDTPCYSLKPLKVTYVCKCGTKIDYWADLIEAHKEVCEGEPPQAPNPDAFMSESMKFKLENPSPYFLALMEVKQ